MAITFPAPLPNTTDIETAALAMQSVVAVSKSPFTGVEQIQKHQGQWFTAKIQLSPMNRPDAEVWLAFLASLNGRENTFLLGDSLGATARGTVAGTPLVNGASQTGNSLTTNGWDVGATILAGDYIQLGSGSTAELYKVLEDETADGSGEATLDIWPDLRSTPGDTDAIVVSNTVGVFRLDGNITQWTERTVLYNIAFGATEAL